MGLRNRNALSELHLIGSVGKTLYMKLVRPCAGRVVAHFIAGGCKRDIGKPWVCVSCDWGAREANRNLADK